MGTYSKYILKQVQEKLNTGLNVTVALRELGISQSTYYNFLRDNPDFKIIKPKKRHKIIWEKIINRCNKPIFCN